MGSVTDIALTVGPKGGQRPGVHVPTRSLSLGVLGWQSEGLEQSMPGPETHRGGLTAKALRAACEMTEEVLKVSRNRPGRRAQGACERQHCRCKQLL